MKLGRIVDTSAAVAATRSRNAKRDALAACLTDMTATDVFAGTCFLSGTLPQGRVGIGPALLRQCAGAPPMVSPTLDLADVNRAVDTFLAAKGQGSAATRRECLMTLFRDATSAEQRFLVRLFAGELRQGALQGVMAEAIAKAWRVPPSEIRRAHMLCGDIAEVAAIAAADGEAGISRVRLRVGTPIQSMLAKPAETLDHALRDRADAEALVFDVKMDGARVQVHKNGSDVAVFSRALNDVSASVPEVVEIVRQMPVHSAILGGEDLVAAPYTQRLSHLDDVVPALHIMPRLMTADLGAAKAFLDDALAAGHEGIMAKRPASTYEAGGRGGAWLKIKRSHTLDLVVLAAEWGSGRRRGRLSNLHLGARHPSGGFVMLGKTFKGLTDKLLAWQTRALLELATERAGHVVHVQPKLVVEIAFNDVQESSQYPGGVALRFARVKRYRQDKTAQDADTIETVYTFLPVGLGDRADRAKAR